jgi:hypothetical protein
MLVFACLESITGTADFPGDFPVGPCCGRGGRYAAIAAVSGAGTWSDQPARSGAGVVRSPLDEFGSKLLPNSIYGLVSSFSSS